MATLDDSRPIHIGCYRYRSANGFIGLFVVAVLDGATIWALATHRPFPRVLLLAPILFTSAVLWVARAVIFNFRRVYSVSADGIRNGRRFVPWSDIARFGACDPDSELVQLFYTTKPYPRGFHLLLSNGISPGVYEDLIDTLRKEIQERFPNVVIGGYEVRPHR